MWQIQVSKVFSFTRCTNSMDSLRQERGFSSGEKDNLGHPLANVNGEHGVAGTQEGAPGTVHRVPGAHQAVPGACQAVPGTVHRVPGACQAVPGVFVPQRLTQAEAYMGSCQPESCQERLSAPRQRKVTNLSCVPKSIMFLSVPKCTFQNVPIPTNQVQLLKTPETSVKDFESEEL